MQFTTGNLFVGLPPAASPAEQFDILWPGAHVRVERIVSWGHATALGERFDQENDEWVVLLSGAARLQIEGQSEPLNLRSGDWAFLPARLRHRVEWTDLAGPTVWLAVHAAVRGEPAT